MYASVAETSWADEIFPEITLISEPHPQYQFGFSALLFACGLGLFYYSIRAFKSEQYQVTRSVVLSAALFLGITIGAAVLFGILTDSHIIKVTGAYYNIVLNCYNIVRKGQLCVCVWWCVVVCV